MQDWRSNESQEVQQSIIMHLKNAMYPLVVRTIIGYIHDLGGSDNH